MRFFLLVTAGACLFLLLGSCGINNALVLNQNQILTQVNLGEENFKVVDRVSGSAEASYVLIFGGRNKRNLYATAYGNMLDKAELNNRSKAVVNVLTEEHIGGFPPFFYKRTLTISANVVEFGN